MITELHDRPNGPKSGSLTRLLLGAAALVAASCDTGATGDVAMIENTRIASRSFSPVEPGKSLRERLLAGRAPVAEPPPAAPGNRDMPIEEMVDIDYELPEGWKAVAPTTMRKVNLVLEKNPETILYATLFLDEGGELMNVNRWRQQMGLDPIGPEELATLERRPMFTGQALCVDLQGTFTGMGGAPMSEAGMLGAILRKESIKLSLFAKMVGPADVVAAERQRFYDFIASIALRARIAPSPLKWEGPPGWEAELSKTEYRDVTFRKDGLEMYVSRARGTVSSNVNRWALQLQMAPLDDAQLAALPRLDAMGGQAVIFEGEGSFRGMMDKEARSGQRMLATVIPMPGSTDGDIVTVKLTGPEGPVAAARSDFESLVTSLALSGR